MFYSYVYYIISEKRLIIMQKPVKDTNFYELMNSSGDNAAALLSCSKLFCIGFLKGTNEKLEIINKAEEFST